jgi:hypothetical protein
MTLQSSNNRFGLINAGRSSSQVQSPPGLRLNQNLPFWASLEI